MKQWLTIPRPNLKDQLQVTILFVKKTFT
jgi:hypothetical protein